MELTTNPADRAGNNHLRRGILHARPRSTRTELSDLSLTLSPTPGLHPLELGADRDGFLYIPLSYRADRGAPLLVMLHGHTGNAHGTILTFKDLANELGLILLAPESRASTWDVLNYGYGPDVHFTNRALEKVFRLCHIDPCRVAIGGFSDGASYALSLGMINGDLFTHVLAFSPGCARPTRQKGEPRFYISHGVNDTVLAIDHSSRRLVPALETSGYDLIYREFDGGHTIPASVADEALRWFQRRPQPECALR